MVLINTVDSIKNKYTVKEYSNACKAQSIQDMIGRPSTKDFIKYVEGNMLPNCPINKSDIVRAEEILGPNLGSLKGKTTRKTPSRVHIMALNDLPDELLEQHNIKLAIDIMYINKVIPFINTTSCNIHFGMAEMIKNERKSTLMTSLKQIIDAYSARGFEIKHILANGQFECLKKSGM